MGQLEIVTLQEFAGIWEDFSSPSAIVPPNVLLEAQDCDLYPYIQGCWLPNLFATLPAGQVVRRVGYLPEADTFLVLTEQKAFRVTSAGTVTDITPTSGFTGSQHWQVTAQQGKLYFVNGIDYIGEFDGNSITYSTVNGAPRGARFITSYQGHLVAADVLDAAGVRRPNMVRLSDIFQPTIWNGGIATDILLDSKSPITGLVVVQNTLVVFTRTEIFTLPYVGATTVGMSPVIVQKQYEGVGCVAPGTVAVTPDGQIFFLAEDGFYRYNLASPPELISPYMKNLIQQIDRTATAQFCSCVIPQQSVYVVRLPLQGTSPQARAFHYRVGGWTRYLHGHYVNATSMQTLYRPTGWFAYVGVGNEVRRIAAPTGTTWVITTAFSDYGIPEVKRFQWMEIVGTPGTYYVTLRFGESAAASQTRTGPSVVISGTSTVLPARLYAPSIWGKYLSVSITSNAAGLHRIVLALERKGWRAS